MAIIINHPIPVLGDGSGAMAITEKGRPRAWRMGYKGNGAGSYNGRGYGNGNMALYPIEDEDFNDSTMDFFDRCSLYSMIDEKDLMDGSGWGNYAFDLGYGCGFGADQNKVLADMGCMFGEPIMPEYMDIDGYDNWNEENHLRLQIQDEKLFH